MFSGYDYFALKSNHPILKLISLPTCVLYNQDNTAETSSLISDLHWRMRVRMLSKIVGGYRSITLSPIAAVAFSVVGIAYSEWAKKKKLHHFHFALGTL